MTTHSTLGTRCSECGEYVEAKRRCFVAGGMMCADCWKSAHSRVNSKLIALIIALLVGFWVFSSLKPAADKFTDQYQTERR